MPRPTHFPDAPNQIHVAAIFFDFANDGGDTGTYWLPGLVPKGAILLNAIVRIFTAFASENSTATVTISLDYPGNSGIALLNSTAVSSLDSPGIKPTQIMEPGENYEPALINHDPGLITKLVIGVEPITAGKLAVYIEYIFGADEHIDGPVVDFED